MIDKKLRIVAIVIGVLSILYSAYSFVSIYTILSLDGHFDISIFFKNLIFTYLWLSPLSVIGMFLVVLLNQSFKGKFRKDKDVESPNKIVPKTILFAVMLSIFHVAAIVFFVKNGIDGTLLLIIGKAVQFPAHQILVLLPLFFFGFYVYKKQWLTKGDIGNWKIWKVMACVSIALYAILFHVIVLPLLNEVAKVAEHNLLSANEATMPAFDRSFLIGAASTFFLSPLACVFILMFFLSFKKRFFNKPNVITTFCSKHSINVYVLHYVLVFI